MIASRKSDLARLQALEVGEALKSHNPHLDIIYHFRESLGDREQNNPLWQMPEKGVFTEDFLHGLRQGEFDLVVHSWKDLPTDLRPDTEVVATLPRADARDVLLIRKDENLAERRSWRILSSSPRRAYFLGEAWEHLAPRGSPGLTFKPVRGNVPTRLRKLMAAEGEGLVVAKAALDRLLSSQDESFREARETLREVLDQCRIMVLPHSVQPPAAGQGALAIEIKRGRTDLWELLQTIHCSKTFQAVHWERSQLQNFGGGCHLKFGAFAVTRGELQLRIQGGLKPNEESFRQHLLSRKSPPPGRPAVLCSVRSADLFETEDLPVPKLPSALYVSHSRAWVPQARSAQWLWTAGLETWKRLAQQGLWVSGSDESWGEQRPSIDLLAGERLAWTKLSHAEGMTSLMPVCATYRLKPKLEIPTSLVEGLKSSDHFFWHSGSAFERAWELFPFLRDRFHCAGIGATRQAIEARLGPIGESQVFLNEQEWRQFYGG